MNTLPSVSIITTSLNRRALLEKTLASVLRQSYPVIGQIVVDGGSTDGTVELLQEYEKKFQEKHRTFKWVSERDSGQGEAMNKGLRMATGEFVMILNSDDFLYDDTLAKFMSALAHNPAIDFIYGNHNNLEENGEERTITHRLYAYDELVNGGFQIPQSGAIFRRTLVERAGGFDEHLKHVAEHDLFTRMVMSGAEVRYLPEILQVTLEHPGRKTTANALNAWRETRRVNRKNGGSYFSRFTLLYAKGVYFGWFFNFLKRKFPAVHRMVKSSFNRLTSEDPD